jgi:hypothetical protein
MQMFGNPEQSICEIDTPPIEDAERDRYCGKEKLPGLTL